MLTKTGQWLQERGWDTPTKGLFVVRDSAGILGLDGPVVVVEPCANLLCPELVRA